MGVTRTYKLRYPEHTDPLDTAKHLQNIAEDLDAAFGVEQVRLAPDPSVWSGDPIPTIPLGANADFNASDPKASQIMLVRSGKMLVVRMSLVLKQPAGFSQGQLTWATFPANAWPTYGSIYGPVIAASSTSTRAYSRAVVDGRLSVLDGRWFNEGSPVGGATYPYDMFWANSMYYVSGASII